jgi:coenzyme F420-reducing hydrogenase delta subunit
METPHTPNDDAREEMFEPRIAGFFCHTCCSGGEDNETLVRETLPHNLVDLKYLCASMVEPSHLQEAFAEDIDGVLICGCLVGNCLNSNDNPDVLKSIHHTTMTLQAMGISPERIRREWVCIPGGETYEGALADFVEFIRELGPLKKAATMEQTQEA